MRFPSARQVLGLKLTNLPLVSPPSSSWLLLCWVQSILCSGKKEICMTKGGKKPTDTQGFGQGPAEVLLLICHKSHDWNPGIPSPECYTGSSATWSSCPRGGSDACCVSDILEQLADDKSSGKCRFVLLLGHSWDWTLSNGLPSVAWATPEVSSDPKAQYALQPSISKGRECTWTWAWVCGKAILRCMSKWLIYIMYISIYIDIYVYINTSGLLVLIWSFSQPVPVNLMRELIMTRWKKNEKSNTKAVDDSVY